MKDVADVYEFSSEEDTKSGHFRLSRKWLIVLLLLLFYILIRFLVFFKLDWTWFNVLGYMKVFWRTFSGKILLGTVIFVTTFCLSYLNIFCVFKIAKKPLRPFLSLIFAFFVALFVTSNGSHFWLQILQSLHAEPFGVTDPQFNLDIGFYVFRLPVFWLIYRLVNLLLLLNVVAAVPLYLFLLSGKIEISTQYMTKRIFTKEERQAITHIGFLLGLIFVVQALRYKLLTYELLFSQAGSVIGAGAAELGAKLPGYYVMIFLSLALGIFVFFFLPKNIKKVLFSVAAYFIAAALITGFFPGVYQKFIVDPDELRQELPYLERNIAFTRQAYGLENLTTEEYPVTELTSAEINKNRDIIDNIRLLDHRATRSTYGQQQEIRLYYDFIDVDVDRYLINGKPTQVLLAARELNRKVLPDRAKTFNNLMFKYTHGFGLVMSPANAVSETGLPQYLIKDIPPQSALDL
ncbi:MAG: UPF0182 family protein, partial [Peptococcia bacterium]